jgi:hypothetical protein
LCHTQRRPIALLGFLCLGCGGRSLTRQGSLSFRPFLLATGTSSSAATILGRPEMKALTPTILSWRPMWCRSLRRAFTLLLCLILGMSVGLFPLPLDEEEAKGETYRELTVEEASPSERSSLHRGRLRSPLSNPAEWTRAASRLRVSRAAHGPHHGLIGAGVTARC